MSEQSRPQASALPTVAARRRGARTSAEYAALYGISLDEARRALYAARKRNATTADRLVPASDKTTARQARGELEAMASDLADTMVQVFCSAASNLPAATSAKVSEGLHTILTAMRGIAVPGTTATDRKLAKAIVAAVMVEYDIASVGEFFGPRRSRTISRPRQTAMALIREHCNAWSLPAIGRFVGGRDHTTVMHACRRHADYMRKPEYAAAVARIMAAVAHDES